LDARIEKAIEIAATPARVFAALTEPEQIRTLFPFEKVESERRVGGSYTCHGTVDGEPFTDHGVITAFDSGRVFGYRYWSTNHGTERTPENEISICYELEPTGAGTQLRVVQENLPSQAYARMMGGVWDQVLEHMKRVIESPWRSA